MRATSVELIDWAGQRARLAPWRGDPVVAHLIPLAGTGRLTFAFVERCVERAAAAGYDRVVTSALSPGEQYGFRAAGFAVAEDLYLLAHDLRAIPSAQPIAMRRVRRDDAATVVDLDSRAFPEFWRLDEAGLAEAVDATAFARYRVAVLSDEVVGYAITGRSGRRGYLQRLAVDPDVQRQGVGSALVVDGLRWLRRWRATRALVNTQLENMAALALYESLGFHREPSGLSVLARDLDG